MRIGKNILAILGLVVFIGLAGCLETNTEEDAATSDTTTTPTASVEVCDDGADNDGDGQIDCSDSDCTDYAVCSGTGTETDTEISFTFEGLNATKESVTYVKDGKDVTETRLVLRGYVRNNGDVQAKVTIAYRAQSWDLAVVSSGTITPEVSTLEPGLRSAFKIHIKPADAEGNEYQTLIWTFWGKYTGSTNEEWVAFYPMVAPYLE